MLDSPARVPLRVVAAGDPVALARAAALCAAASDDHAAVGGRLDAMAVAGWTGAAADAFAAEVARHARRHARAARLLAGLAGAVAGLALELEAAHHAVAVAAADGDLAGVSAGQAAAVATLERVAVVVGLATPGRAAPAAPRARPSLAARVGHVAWHVTLGVLDDARALLMTAVAASPTRVQTDPLGWLRDEWAQARAAAALAGRPGHALWLLADVDTWRHDPARATGRLAGDLLLTLGSGGAGVATKAGALDQVGAARVAAPVPGGSALAVHAWSADQTALRAVYRRWFHDHLTVNAERYHRDLPGFDENCRNCAVATDAMLDGRPAAALPGGPANVRHLAADYDAPWQRAASYDDIVAAMTDGGPGARGFVLGTWKAGSGGGVRPGHIFNVVNHDRLGVVFLDGQVGFFARLDAYDTLMYLRTS